MQYFPIFIMCGISRKVLIENKGLVLSRNQILDDVWGYDCDVIDRTIDAYIRNIRKKLRLDCITVDLFSLLRSKAVIRFPKISIENGLVM